MTKYEVTCVPNILMVDIFLFAKATLQKQNVLASIIESRIFLTWKKLGLQFTFK